MTKRFPIPLLATLLGFAAAAPGAGVTGAELFDDSQVQEIRLTTHPSDWRRLQDNFQDDTYYPAILEWRGVVLEDIGIRSRGNGSRNGTKPGLKLDFNKYVPGQEFLGLKSLVLDNLTQDAAMMAERISMLLFRKMGIPAPRIAHARLYVNNVYAGLYTLVEPVDKGFLKRNLGEDGGYLYDYEWADENWFEYRGEDLEAYSPIPFQPQTNEKNPDARPIEQMIRTINESPDTEFVAAVSRYIDLQRFLEYLATETFLSDPDGLVGLWGANNFYLYRFQKSDLSIFLPWDKDMAFHDPHRSIWVNTEKNVLTRRLLAVPEIREYYLTTLERVMELAGGPGGWLEREIEREYEQIRVAAADDPNRPFSYSEFEWAVDYFRSFAFERAGFLANEIADSRAGGVR
jgi:spore coat protein CotH